MASPNSSISEALSAATNKYLTEGGFKDNIFRFPKLLSLYKANGAYKSEDGGVQLQVPLMYATNPTVTSANPYDAIALTQDEIATSATYSWAQWQGAMVMSKMELFQNSGASRLINLMEAKRKALEMTTAQDLNDALFAGNTTKVTNCLGLDQLIEATGTVGGIDSSTQTWWRSTVNSSSTALTESILETAFLSAYNNIDLPDIIVTTQTLYGKYMDLTRAKAQIQIADTRTAELGFESANFKGRPLVYDASCASGDVYILNWEDIALYYGEGFDFAVSPQAELPAQHVFAWKLIWIGQQAVNSRRMHGRLRAKTT